jgi:drug/metabolite transporter (DMT)-like permease
MPRAVIDYRPAGSGGDSSGEAIRHLQHALVFFGLLGFGVGCFGGFYGNIVTIPDGQRVLGAVMLLGCAMGYVVLRAMNSTANTVSRIALSLTSASAVFGAAVACAFRFPHRPLDNPVMLATGLAIVGIGVALFAATRSMMKRPAAQSFEK